MQPSHLLPVFAVPLVPAPGAVSPTSPPGDLVEPCESLIGVVPIVNVLESASLSVRGTQRGVGVDAVLMGELPGAGRVPSEPLRSILAASDGGLDGDESVRLDLGAGRRTDAVQVETDYPRRRGRKALLVQIKQLTQDGGSGNDK